MLCGQKTTHLHKHYDMLIELIAISSHGKSS